MRAARPSHTLAPHALALLTLPLMLAPATAAEWRIRPGVEVRQSYSDNIRLAPRGAELGDFVTEIMPRVTVTADGPRLKVEGYYALDSLHYWKNSRLNNFMQNAQGKLAAELVDNFVYFDARGAITQQNVNAFGPQIADNINAPDGRTEVRSISLSPYLKHRFSSFANGELRYAHDIVNSSNDLLANTTADRVSFQLANGEAFGRFGWGLNYSDQKLHYSNNGSNVDISNYAANLRYAIIRSLALTATYGHEKYGYQALNDQNGGDFYAVGFSWRPSERTKVDASVGERFYGRTYSLSANHRARRTVWNIVYSEDITTAQGQFGAATVSTSSFLDRLWLTSIPDADTRRAAVDAFIRDTGLPSSIPGAVNSLSNRFFLQKNLQASVAFAGQRNTAVLSIYNTRRTPQSTPIGTESNLPPLDPSLADFEGARQSGAHALWSLRVAANTDANFSTSINKVVSNTGARSDKNLTLRASLSHRFSRRLSGSAEIRHITHKTNLGGGDARENALSASATYEF